MVRVKEKKDFEKERTRLVQTLTREGIIKSEAVARAFQKVPRELFTWPRSSPDAYIDTPLPLGDTGQTISAPHMVAAMLEELHLTPGLKVLEIGAGSGYSAALMTEIVAPRELRKEERGRIVSVERIPELVDFAKANVQAAGYGDAVFVVLGDGTLGYPERSVEELYERIVVTAAAPRIPEFLKLQLKVGGTLLLPMGDAWIQTLVRGVKQPDGRLLQEELCGCVFVPLLGSYE